MLYFQREVDYYFNKTSKNKYENFQLTLICLGDKLTIPCPDDDFLKMYLLKKMWSTSFWWILILFQNTSLLKFSLNFLKSFRRYEKNSLSILAIFINFLKFFGFFYITVLLRNLWRQIITDDVKLTPKGKD